MIRPYDRLVLADSLPLGAPQKFLKYIVIAGILTIAGLSFSLEEIWDDRLFLFITPIMLFKWCHLIRRLPGYPTSSENREWVSTPPAWKGVEQHATEIQIDRRQWPIAVTFAYEEGKPVLKDISSKLIRQNSLPWLAILFGNPPL